MSHRISFRGLLATGAALGGLMVAGPALAAEMPGDGVDVTPATSSIAEEIFQTKILMMGLEELGYDVNAHIELAYPTMHLGIANGDITYSATHWDPLHKAFFEKAGGEDEIWRSNAYIENSLQGYLIDKKTADEYDIDNVEDLKDPEIAKLFDADGDGKADLTGCNPGWGCERVIEHHLDEYGLRDTVEHNQGSYFALMADTITRFENGEPILYYTWTPLWVSGVLAPGDEVEWLEVPYTSLPDEQNPETETAEGLNLGFAVNTQRIMATKDWIEENPAAAAFFDAADLPVNDVSAQNLLMREGEDSIDDIERHAATWIEENRKEFDSWLKAARDAAAQ
ncbi:L-proline glycine betaine binding ABC transporter protein ProX [Caenispirillum salinarum AK4]|uniref:L-proline glycine betaine binding ABC transporter protein ProX n=1 Tax=Caenispirillum salinarum AK4 TaxID=1238182 RepID=K9HDY9_9PROT|nr:glycine betaine/L-proline ABC transporter substrate-binding protein ProX [Caenispirillum salinarum]EKV28693.1 L-proline glycine betaine binding ABC transporter protein ProX [Caenispirillum salinarum AK4]